MAQPVLKIEILKCRKSISMSLQFAEVAASQASPILLFSHGVKP